MLVDGVNIIVLQVATRLLARTSANNKMVRLENNNGDNNGDDAG